MRIYERWRRWRASACLVCPGMADSIALDLDERGIRRVPFRALKSSLALSESCRFLEEPVPEVMLCSLEVQ